MWNALPQEDFWPSELPDIEWILEPRPPEQEGLTHLWMPVPLQISNSGRVSGSSTEFRILSNSRVHGAWNRTGQK